MKKIIVTCFLILPFTLFSQVVEDWSQTFGGNGNDYGYSVQQTNDGGYIIIGSIYSFGDSTRDIYLIKTNEFGEELWSQTFGGEYSDVGRSVIQTSDNGYILTGRSSTGQQNHTKILVIKTDELGEEQWSRSIGNDSIGGLQSGDDIIQINDGGYVFTGTIRQDGSKMFLMKINENGLDEWIHTYNDLNGGWGTSLKQTNDGGFIVSGWGVSETTPEILYDGYLVKTNENGEEQWGNTYNYDVWDRIYSVQKTSDGGYVLVGMTKSSQQDQSKIYLLKTNENGVEEWNQIIEGEQGVRGRCVLETGDGEYLILGTINIDSLDTDIYLIKMDESGQEQLSQTFGGNGNDSGYSVQQTNDGGYIIVGSTEVDSLNTDVYLIKMNGNNTSVNEFFIPDPNRKLEKIIDLLGREVKREPNLPLIEIYDDGSVEKRVIIE